MFVRAHVPTKSTGSVAVLGMHYTERKWLGRRMVHPDTVRLNALQAICSLRVFGVANARASDEIDELALTGDFRRVNLWFKSRKRGTCDTITGRQAVVILLDYYWLPSTYLDVCSDVTDNGYGRNWVCTLIPLAFKHGAKVVILPNDRWGHIKAMIKGDGHILKNDGQIWFYLTHEEALCYHPLFRATEIAVHSRGWNASVRKDQRHRINQTAYDTYLDPLNPFVVFANGLLDLNTKHGVLAYLDNILDPEIVSTFGMYRILTTYDGCRNTYVTSLSVGRALVACVELKKGTEMIRIDTDWDHVYVVDMDNVDDVDEVTDIATEYGVVFDAVITYAKSGSRKGLAVIDSNLTIGGVLRLHDSGTDLRRSHWYLQNYPNPGEIPTTRMEAIYEGEVFKGLKWVTTSHRHLVGLAFKWRYQRSGKEHPSDISLRGGTVQRRYGQPGWIARRRKIGRGLVCKPSTLGPAAGNGLVADEDISGRECICEYSGCVRDRQTRFSMTHSIGINRTHVIDGYRLEWPEGSDPAALANDSRGSRPYNAVFVITDNVKLIGANRSGDIAPERVWLMALVDIAKGDEIFANYGNAYWIRIGESTMEE